MYGELKRFNAVVKYSVKSFDIVARRVLQSADILNNKIAGYIFGIYRTAYVNALKYIVKLKSVDFGYYFYVLVF